MKFHGNVDLPAGGSASLRTLIVENLGLSPPFVATEKGRLYFNNGTQSAKAAFRHFRISTAVLGDST